MKRKLALSILLLSVLLAVKAQYKSLYIEGLDMMRYSVEEIRVSPGIEITLKTVSSIPKSQMAHNWVLLKEDIQDGIQL